MRMVSLAVLPALLLITVGDRPACADGISVKKHLSLEELAKTSDAIFTATLLENDTRWGAIEVRGENQRFVQEYRFRIAITGWLKGKRAVPAKGVPWLSLPGDYVPGVWTVVEERYDASFDLVKAKAGDKVVVFCSASELQGWGERVQDGRAVVWVRAVETEARLPAVKAALVPRSRTAPSSEMIRCECTVLEHIPKFEYCDHDDVPAGSPSSIGRYPAFRIKLTKPAEYKGREIRLILRGASFRNLSGSRGKYAGKRCALDLPADFLAGKYTRHLGHPDPHFKIVK